MSSKISRREVLLGASMVPMVATAFAAREKKPPELGAAEWLKLNDLDRQIWQEELEEFVPERLYDMHAHLGRTEFNLDVKSRLTARNSADPSEIFEEKGSLELFESIEALLNPGRKVQHLLMPVPYKNCDFAGSNKFVASEASKRPDTRALMIVHPRMTAEEIEKNVKTHRFVGFKPYLWYAPTKDVWQARIPDFMPEHQIAVANHFGLIIGIHISKKQAISDPENLADLERLTGKYPRVRWILYHNARSYSPWSIDRAASRLSRLHNIWIETSSVCESAAFDASFSTIPIDRLMYGTDGIARGKYVAWGHGWAQMDGQNQTFPTTHCDGRSTFVRYEMLRAIRRASKNMRFTKEQIADLFYNNAERLVASAWKDLNSAL